MLSANHEFQQIEESHSGVPFNEWLSEDIKRAQSLAQLIDHVSMEVYLRPGHMKARNKLTIRLSRPLANKQRDLSETIAVLDELADLGVPSIAHYLIETLVGIYPARCLRRYFSCVGRVVRAGEQRAYQNELMAAGLIVKLVERYLALIPSIASGRHRMSPNSD